MEPLKLSSQEGSETTPYVNDNKSHKAEALTFFLLFLSFPPSPNTDGSFVLRSSVLTLILTSSAFGNDLRGPVLLSIQEDERAELTSGGVNTAGLHRAKKF
jgi:hypothetical protein